MRYNGWVECCAPSNQSSTTLLISCTCELPLAQLLCFDIHAKCRGCRGSPRTLLLFLVLFRHRVKRKPFRIKRYRTLAENTGVWGYSSQIGTAPCAVFTRQPHLCRSGRVTGRKSRQVSSWPPTSSCYLQLSTVE